MDFLYRMPLVDFDPLDPKQITLHWNWIKKAISLSSSSLFEKIDQREFGSLHPETQSKVHKYLLRGRYRPTPFGMWAGVGITSWGKHNQLELPLTYQAIEEIGIIEELETEDTAPYQLAPGLVTYSHQVHFWTYCKIQEGWRVSYMEKNRLIEVLLSYFNRSKLLHFQRFQHFFRSKDQELIFGLWQNLIQTGFLLSTRKMKSFNSATDPSVDIKINSKITLPNSGKEQLQKLVQEIGNLFVPVESEYLKHFKSWFFHTYDDRFVPLEDLASIQEFSLSPETGDQKGEQDAPLDSTALTHIWQTHVSCELSDWFEAKPTEFSHLQLVFKQGENGEIFIENMVCNRPFAYSGRFSKDPEVRNLIAKGIHPTSPEIEFADLILYESAKSRTIASHVNAFHYSIYPFGKGLSSQQLGIDDLWIGIRKKRIFLFSNTLNKEVIPKVQHPLNPNQISHPLSRLLWEIGNQDQYRFLLYHDPLFQKADYLPRFTWKGIVLQGRRWTIELRNFPQKDKLLPFFQQKGLPCPLLAGHLDRELVLNWRNTMELDFLWEELRRTGQISLYECPWVESTPFQNRQGQNLYPQFVYAWKGNPIQTTTERFLNRIGEKDENWIYWRIQLKPDGLIPFLKKSLPSILRGALLNNSIQKWYFLRYNAPATEVRLRLLPDSTQKDRLVFELEKELQNCGWVDKLILAPYYPEHEKYSHGPTGVQTSEGIFHRESTLIVLGTQDQAPLLSQEMQDRENWIIDTYLSFILQCQMESFFFRYYQELFKEIPQPERKKISKQLNFREKKSSHQGKAAIQKEFDQIASEPDKEVLSRLIPNHIHLCCNRMFPEQSRYHEQKVIYGLYKMLGKAIYG